VPFVTGWMDENHFAPLTVAAYGAVLLACAISYQILTGVLRTAHPADSLIARALGPDRKGKASLVVYVVAVPAAFLDSRISLSCYVAVALLWLVPDRRFEKLLTEHKR
jgi:uncharacterized membrane protein